MPLDAPVTSAMGRVAKTMARYLSDWADIAGLRPAMSPAYELPADEGGRTFFDVMCHAFLEVLGLKRLDHGRVGRRAGFR